MAKPNIIHDIEMIADRVSKQNIRKHQNLIRLGQWVKELQEENRLLKQRLFTLELRVKKLNDYGATPLTKSEQAVDQQRQVQQKQKITGAHLKRFRLGRSLSQAAMGALFDVTAQKYARLENARSLAPAVEDRFREIQKWPATKLRSELQERGHFLTTGKKTKIPKLPAEKPTKQADVKKAENLIPESDNSPKKFTISKEQIRQLREALGYTRPQLADFIGCKKRTLASWEAGERNANGPFAEKLLELYKQQFSEQKQTASVNRRTSARKIYESPAMPVAKIRAGRASSGMSSRQVAEALGVPLSTYKNWEAGNSKPSDIYIEKMLGLFGSFPTESAQASAKIEQTPIPADKITGSQIRDFRRTVGATRTKFAEYLQIPLSQYQNWEHPRRSIPQNYHDKVKALMTMNPDDIKRLLGITPPPNTAPIVQKTKRSVPGKIITCDEIKQFRMSLGLSGSQMAEFLKVSLSVYKNWETAGRRVGDEFYAQVAAIYDLEQSVLAKKVTEFLGDRKPAAGKPRPKVEVIVDDKISADTMKAIRLRFGITQPQMATLLKLDMSTYQHWEVKGRFVPKKYAHIVQELGRQSATEIKKMLSTAGITPQQPHNK